MTRASEEEAYDPMMWDSAMMVSRKEDCSLACLMTEDCQLSYITPSVDETLCFMIKKETQGYQGSRSVILFKKTCKSGMCKCLPSSIQTRGCYAKAVILFHAIVI